MPCRVRGRVESRDGRCHGRSTPSAAPLARKAIASRQASITESALFISGPAVCLMIYPDVRASEGRLAGVHYQAVRQKGKTKEFMSVKEGRSLGICVVWIGGLIAALSPLQAQIGGAGTVQGVVSDPSGAVVPAATVIATNEGTGTKTVRLTTAAGYYVVSPLPAGQYTIAVSAPGFENVVQQHVVVDALATVGLNLTLKVGSASESVTVTAASPVVDTSDARVGQTVRNELYTALPLAMGNAPRDPTAFVQYMPGVVPGGSNAAGQVFGSQANTQEVYVEGLPITNAVVEGEVRNLGLGVSVEAVDQFQLESGGAAVQYGGMGATNFVLKSGTNKFHGSAYEIFRNTVLDARGFFAASRPPEHQNEFGFTVSGPIVKNRIFF